MKRGLDWYKREPVAYLGGVQGMTAREHAVFGVVVDLLYVHGGSINHDPAWIAGWIADMGAAAVRNTLEVLAARGKLTIADGQITQRRVADEVKTRQKLSENRSEIGKKGGVSSGNSRREASENKDLAEAKTPDIEKRREEKKETPTVSPKKGTRLPSDWVLPRDWGEWALADPDTPHRTADQVRFEAARFRDFWASKTGQGATKRDWLATWRNWCRNARPFLAHGGPHNGQSPREAEHERRLHGRLERAAARDLERARQRSAGGAGG